MAASTLPKWQDWLELEVSDSELASVDSDIRPTWREGGMPCPGRNCSSKIFSTFKAMKIHWKRRHVPELVLYRCGICRFSSPDPNQVQRHLSRQHGHSREEAHTVMVTVRERKEVVPNTQYVSPGDALMPIAPVSARAAAYRDRIRQARVRAAALYRMDNGITPPLVYQTRDEEVVLPEEEGQATGFVRVRARGSSRELVPLSVDNEAYLEEFED